MTSKVAVNELYKHSYTSYVKGIYEFGQAAKNVLEIPLDPIKLALLTREVLVEAKVYRSEDITVPAPIQGIWLACKVLKIPTATFRAIQHYRQEAKSDLDQAERILNIGANVSDIALGTMASIQLFDLIAMGHIAKEMGAATVLSKSFTQLAPFTAVVTVIDLIKTAIEIGISAIAMYKTCKKVDALRDKTILWEAIDWKGYAPQKREHLETKQLSSSRQLAEMNEALKTSVVALQSAITKSDQRRAVVLTQENPIGRFFEKIKLTIAEVEQGLVKRKLKKESQAYQKLASKHDIRKLKIKNWQVVESKDLTENDLRILTQFKERQLAKLDIKKGNLNQERLKIGLDIAFKTVVAITLIASLVLIFTVGGTVPGIITSITLMLFLAAAEYGLKKFKEFYFRPQIWERHYIPDLSRG